MATTLDLALLAGASYFSTRAEINRFPIPASWNELIAFRDRDDSTGFEARTFQSATEIVISYAGTYPGQAGDIAADVNLGAGGMHTQLLQAIEYYLQVKAANPGATISLTGHSLGGGLASLVAVFFGVTAQTFDQAPFAPAAHNLGSGLYVTLLGKGYSAAALAPLNDFNIAMLSASGGAVHNAGYVTNINVQGELLSQAPFNQANRIGVTTENIANTASGVGSVDLHSQALLSAYLQSKETAPTGKALNEVTVKLPDLLKMIFDGSLFAFSTATTNTTQANFLEHLVRHEAGVQGTFLADAMVTRFTSDLWKIAQDGGLTLNDGSLTKDLTKALTAFAMQKYYNEHYSVDTPIVSGFGSNFFTSVTGGIRFDMSDVSSANAQAAALGTPMEMAKIKGYEQYFKYYLANISVFSTAERTLIQSALPNMRDWYVQAGTAGLAETHNQNWGAFMVGGLGIDALVGGSKADLLVGNAGNDVLQGRGGNDMLLGGTGADTYIYQAGDGLDTILDRDGNGSILMDGQTLAGGSTSWAADGTLINGVVDADFADVIYATARVDKLLGFGGHDVMEGGEVKRDCTIPRCRKIKNHLGWSCERKRSEWPKTFKAAEHICRSPCSPREKRRISTDTALPMGVQP